MNLAELGCLKSHLNVLLQAYRKGCNWCLVLEDDVELIDDFDTKLKHYMISLPHGWAGFWLAGRAVGAKRVNGRACKINRITGTYGYIIAHWAMPFFINELIKGGNLADYCLSRAFNKVPVYVAGENLVKHRAGYSTIKGKFVEYKDLM